MSTATRAELVGGTDKGPTIPARGSRDELHAAGRALRDKCPRESHGIWKAADDRRDPVELVLEAEKVRHKKQEQL